MLTCLMPAEDGAVVQRLAAVQPSDDLEGKATEWNGGMVLNPCSLAE